MNCEEARMLLDAYVDGELSEAELRALMDHAQACESCARELEAARLLQETLAHMDDDVQVPLEAQAAWRSAVRAEAKKKNTRNWIRMAYAVAAALVLVIGANFVKYGIPDKQEQMIQMAAGAPVVANELIVRDGVAPGTVDSVDIGLDYSIWKKISSAEPERDREALKMLAVEYNGVYTEQGEDICCIELSGEYLDDFLNAVSRIGSEISTETACDGEAASHVVIFQFCEE